MPEGTLRDMLLSLLRSRYTHHAIRESADRRAIATFPARHSEVGDLAIAVMPSTLPAEAIGAQVTIGARLADTFENYDTHLELTERAARVTSDVVRFLDALFSDQLLFWVATDGRGSGWRERGDTAQMEPLVTDNRVYHRFVWSGPLPPWQAVPAILGRREVRSEREYEILQRHLRDDTDGPDTTERALARALVDAYERAGREGPR